MRPLLFMLRKEFLQIFRDKMIVRMVFVLPMVQLLILSNAATFEVKSARLYVVDKDHTPMSRGLINRLAASGRFVPTDASESITLADEAMLRRRIDIVVVIPGGFERDITRDKESAVQLILNAEDGAAAGVTQSYASRIIGAYSMELGVDVTPAIAAFVGRESPPPMRGVPIIETERRGWYNPRLDFSHFMVPGILVVLVTMVGTLLTAMNIVREKEIGTLEQLNVTPLGRGHFVAGKLIPFWIIAMIDLAIGLTLARLVFGVPVRGSLLLVFGGAAVYLVAALGIGLWISTAVQTQQQAMFLSFALNMIYLLMSGLFTPLRSMPTWAQWMAEFSPVKHFLVIMRAVLVKGAGLAEVSTPLLLLAAYGLVVFTLAMRQYHKTTA